MTYIEEILGNLQYVGASLYNLNSRVLLEQPNKILYEYNLFDNISMVDQFNTEKQESDLFRIYGKISPIMSLDVYKATTTGDQQITIDQSVFNINLNNWSIVLLKSKQIPIHTKNGQRTDPTQTGSTQQINSKGVKYINKNDPSGNTIFYLDLRNGLPAKTYYNKLNQDNACLFFPLGHNFSVNDKIYITSKNGIIGNGIYIIINIDVNKVYINTPPTSYYPASQNSVTSKSSVNISAQVSKATSISLPTLITKTPQDYTDVILNNSIIVRNLTFDKSVISNLIELRPDIYPYVKSEYNVCKVIEKEKLEYYIKVLEVIDIISDLDNCAFSINNYNTQIMNYFLNHNLDITQYRNNLNEPISDIYVGIVKNGSPDITKYGNVESHFSMFIEYVSEGDGIEEITNNNMVLGKIPKIGDTFYHSLCEYTTEQLTETEICYFNHKFIHNGVLFNYNPFYQIPIKLKTTYIENNDNKMFSPDYAVFSRLEQKYIWRDLLPVGLANENGDVIDFPFFNGALYAYRDINFFVKSEKTFTRQYDLNVNDVTSTGNTYNNVVSDILDAINLATNDTEIVGQNNSNMTGSALPYYQYNDSNQC